MRASTTSLSTLIRLAWTSCSHRISNKRASIRARRFATGCTTAATTGGTTAATMGCDFRRRFELEFGIRATLITEESRPMFNFGHLVDGSAVAAVSQRKNRLIGPADEHQQRDDGSAPDARWRPWPDFVV